MRNNDFDPRRSPRHDERRRAGRRDDDLGFGPGFGPGRPRGRRRGGRGGDVRAAALLLLAEQPRHGYQLIQEIGERSGGSWTPSPGSIYPVLQQLEDEGLLEFERVDGRKTATLTDEGRAHVEEHRESLGAPWESADTAGDHRQLRDSLHGLLGAWKQIAQVGTPEQRTAAATVLETARQDLYRVLAGDRV